MDRRPAADRWESTQVLQVTRRDGEDSEQLVRRFNKLVQRDGVLQEARRRRHFISNREKERQAQRRAARRRRRTTKPSR
ncbi:MAG: 30S ribosomal protein S21 [Chloroflexi bacterium]|nr:30S ribosomal protein S21 [Chloroflexota bacterium]